MNMLQQTTTVEATQIQAKATGSASSGEGEGIGLFIVRRLSGHLTVETGPDSGTRIAIQFPRHYSEAQAI